jgi:integrase
VNTPPGLPDAPAASSARNEEERLQLLFAQEWLGHSTITMTMRYSHVSPGGNAKLIAALDGLSDPPLATACHETGTSEKEL